MTQKKSNRTTNTKRTEKIKMEIPSTHTEGLPYYADIRMSWKANQKHCDPNDDRGYYKRGIRFCQEWKGEIGWLRYYLFHIDSGYKKGESKLIRIDDGKGFFPDNCRIQKVSNKKNEKKVKAEPANTNSTETKSDDNIPASINNNIMIFTLANGMKPQDIIDVLKNVGNQPIHDNTIYLKSIGNQAYSRGKS